MKKDAYYFPHDANARNDEKLLYIRSKYGIEGYAIYFMIAETMHESSDGKLTCALIDGLAFSNNIDITLLKNFYNDAISIGLFVSDGTKYWSDRVLRNKLEFEEKRLKKSEAGKRGMASRWSNHNDVITEDNSVITNDNDCITEDNKGKQSKAKENKEIEPEDNIYSQVIEYLNSKAGTKYKPNSTKTKDLIKARQNEGFVIEDFYRAIDNKVAEWMGTDWEKFLRPETLFSNKFEGYLNQAIKGAKASQKKYMTTDDYDRILEEGDIFVRPN